MDDFLEIVASIESPCVRFCEIDDVTGLCLGCARKLDEIAGWGSGTPEWRAAVLADLPGRLSATDG